MIKFVAEEGLFWKVEMEGQGIENPLRHTVPNMCPSRSKSFKRLQTKPKTI